MENQAPQEKSNKRLHATYLTIIFLLAGLSVFLSFQYKQLQTIVATHEITIENITTERDNVKTDLESLRDNYDQLTTNDAALNAEIEAKKLYIDSLLVIADKHKDDIYIIAKLKKETNTLREIMKGYIRTIDSLNTLNQQLIVDKNNVLTQLDDQKGKTAALQNDKDALQGRVDRAAMLSTLNVRATGVKSSKGGKKDVETTKASKADKIKVNFDVADNDLTVAGNHEIYIRIITPDAQEMTEVLDANHQFSFGSTTAYFAAKKTIDFENQPMSVLVNCNKAADATLQPGKYIIEIYSDKVMIGTCGLELE